MFVRRRLAIATVVVATVVSSCGYGLNTGNTDERADWEAKAREDAAAAEAEAARQARINTLRDGSIPMTTTTTTTTTTPEDESTTTTTLPLVDPVTGPPWCDGMQRFQQLGDSLVGTSNPTLSLEGIDRLVAYLGEVSAETDDAEVSRRADAVAAVFGEHRGQLAAAEDRGDIVSVFQAFLAANFETLNSFLTYVTPICFDQPGGFTPDYFGG